MTKTGLDNFRKLLNAVVDPAHFFGDDPAAEFRRLSKLYHPDLCPPALRPQATIVFARLNELYSRLNGKNKTPDIQVGKWTLSPTALAVSGDVCNVYHATGPKGAGVIKVCRDPDNNDLMDREVQALKALAKSTLDAKYQKYIPTLLDSFKTGDCRVNVISPVSEGIELPHLVALYDTSDFRHYVWMFNRLLTVLGFIHRNNLVHGSVTPSHLLYMPADHGLVLVDYTAATVNRDGNKIPYISDGWKDLYPKEVRRGIFGEAVDIYMAAGLIRKYCSVIPKRFRPVLDYCMAGSIRSRPSDAWEVQDLWKKAAQEEYGKPKFVEMKTVAI